MTDSSPPAELAALDRGQAVTVTLTGRVDSVWEAGSGTWYLGVSLPDNREIHVPYGVQGVSIQESPAGS